MFETTEYVDPYETLSLDPREEIERMGLEVIDPSWYPDFDDLHNQVEASVHPLQGYEASGQ